MKIYALALSILAIFSILFSISEVSASPFAEFRAICKKFLPDLHFVPSTESTLKRTSYRKRLYQLDLLIQIKLDRQLPHNINLSFAAISNNKNLKINPEQYLAIQEFLISELKNLNEEFFDKIFFNYSAGTNEFLMGFKPERELRDPDVEMLYICMQKLINFFSFTDPRQILRMSKKGFSSN